MFLIMRRLYYFWSLRFSCTEAIVAWVLEVAVPNSSCDASAPCWTMSVDRGQFWTQLTGTSGKLDACRKQRRKVFHSLCSNNYSFGRWKLRNELQQLRFLKFAFHPKG